MFENHAQSTVRRRECRELSKTLAGLGAHAGRSDFAVRTHALVKQVRRLLVTLAGSDREGNTREVLRQVRNTLMNGGWNKYRDSAVRQTVARILTAISEAEVVLPQHVDSVFDLLHMAGLNPAGAPTVAADLEDESGDGDDS